MKPSFIFSYIGNKRFRNIKFSRKIGEYASFIFGKFYFHYLSFRKFIVPIFYTSIFSKNSSGMKTILTLSYIFKVFKSIVRFITVFMIDLFSNGTFSKKSITNNSMDRLDNSLTFNIHSVKAISKLMSTWLDYLSNICSPVIWRYFSPPKSSHITDFIKSITIKNWLPSFLNHTASICKLTFIILSALIFNVNECFSGTISFDQLAVSGDLTVNKYNSDMDRAYIKINTNLQTDNIENNSLQDSSVSSDFSANASPSTRTLEGASCEKVFTGLLTTTTSGTLVGTVPAGTAYPQGRRVRRDTAFSRTWTANRWTYVDIDHNNDLFFQETTIGAAAPSITTNAIRISRVSTDSTQILSVQDLRTTSCTSGPFNIIEDAAGEADLGDILVNGWGGFANGLGIISNDATSLTVQPGTAYINGEYRTLSSNTSPSISTTAAPATSVSGIDTGSVAASTTYYLYGVADEAGVEPMTLIYSTNATSPSGATNYRLLGQATTTSGSSLVSDDVSAVSYLGKIRQIRVFENRTVLTGTVTTPDDDTVPQNSEGNEFLKGSIRPISARNMIRADIFANVATGAGADLPLITALHKGSAVGAVCAWRDVTNTANNYDQNFTYSCTQEAGVATSIAYSVRTGSSTAGTLTFNGAAGARKLGGAMPSTLVLTEFER